MLTWYQTPTLICYTWHQHLTCYYLPNTWYLTLALVFDMLYLTPDLDTWYLTPVLDLLLLNTRYLTHDIWHRYLTCHHLTIDTWLDDWHAITHLTYFHMVLVHLTLCCNTWLDTITPDTCITLHIHDYHFYGDLAWLLYCYQTLVLLNSCALELLYTWTPEKGRLLILYSYWSP